jgi:hypothetical protein
MNEIYKPLNLPDSTCDRCLNSSVWLTSRRKVELCPKIQLGEDHNEPNEISKLFRLQSLKFSADQNVITPQVFELARILAQFSAKHPCRTNQIFAVFFQDTELNAGEKIKKLTAWFKELRSWNLEVDGNANGFWLKGVLQ